MTHGNENIHPFARSVKSSSEDILGNPQTHFRTEMTGGLTKREYFAAMAMQGLIQNHTFYNNADEYADVARIAINNADALIAALNQEAK